MLLGTYVAPSTYQGLGAFFKENVLDKALLTVDRGANTQVQTVSMCVCILYVAAHRRDGTPDLYQYIHQSRPQRPGGG